MKEMSVPETVGTVHCYFKMMCMYKILVSVDTLVWSCASLAIFCETFSISSFRLSSRPEIWLFSALTSDAWVEVSFSHSDYNNGEHRTNLCSCHVYPFNYIFVNVAKGQ